MATSCAKFCRSRRASSIRTTRSKRPPTRSTFAAGAAGFAFVDVRPRYTPNPAKRTVDVTFDVKEGPRVYIDRIDIVGNTQTLDYVIRRQLGVSEGDAYNRALVDRSKTVGEERWASSRTWISPRRPVRRRTSTNLMVKVTEQPTGQLSFSAGYSSLDKVVADIGVTQSNFRGRGENLGLRVSVGSLQQQVDLSFTEPHFLNRDLQGGWDIYAQRYNFTEQASYITTSVGGTVHVAFPAGGQRAADHALHAAHRQRHRGPGAFATPDPSWSRSSCANSRAPI